MKATESSHAQGRGVVLGLAFLFCVAAAADSAALRDTVHRLFRDQSYILIEIPSQAPLLLLMSSSANAKTLSHESLILHQALLNLADTDPQVREDAILTLADIDADASIDILASALADPSPLVRDTAAAILEDISDAKATDFANFSRPMQ